MKLFTFKGGVTPPEHKNETSEKQITEAFPSTKTVTIPVTMGGKENTPVVNVGDKVAKGQIIADSKEFISCPVHSSISGIVKKISTCIIARNKEANCIVIEADDSGSTSYMEELDPLTCDKEQAIKRIRDAGITGMGGASFPTHVKFAAKEKISTVILNASECEPYLNVDYRTILESAFKVIDGFSITLKLAGARGIIALENNKADLVPVLQNAIDVSKYEDIMHIHVVKTKYPQGSEKMIINAILNKEVPAGKLPAQTGCIILNVCTACAISDAFRLGKPLVERTVTFAGGACETPCNLHLPIGTVVSDLIPESISIKNDKLRKIILGGPMMGFSMVNTSFPITKGTGGVLFLTDKETSAEQESPCLNCGMCVNVCPLRLTPAMIVRSVKTGNLDDAKYYGLMDCMECGSCAYVCPAHVRLVQRIRYGKSIVRGNKK